MRKKQALAYVRVSTTHLGQDTKRQIRELQELTKQHGFQLDDSDIYSENISGFKKGKERPVFTKMMNKIRNNPERYSRLYIHEISRLSRNPDEGRKLLNDLTELEVSIYVKSIGQQSINEDGKRNGMFMIYFTILSEFAASEAEYTKMRTMSGMIDKIKDGHAGSGALQPYGYTKDKKTKQLKIDNTESKVIKDIYNWSLSGLGVRQIAHKLNEKGIPTKTQKVFGKEEMVWTDRVVNTILKNSIYKGDRNYRGEVFNAPAIIDTKVWDKVQKGLEQRLNKPQNLQYLYLLDSGKAVCGKCGRNYYARYKAGGKDAYYCCISTRDKGQSCGNRGVSIEALESTVFDLIRGNEKIDAIIKESNVELQKVEGELNSVNADLDILSSKLKKVEMSRERWLQLFVDIKINGDRLDKENKKIDETSEKDRKEYQMLTAKKQSLTETINRIKNKGSYFRTFHQLANDRFQLKTFFEHIIDKVVVRAVKENNNNGDYLLAVYLKDIKEPIVVLMECSRFRNNPLKGGLVDYETAKALRQNWFIYYYTRNAKTIKIENNVLITPIDKALKCVDETLDEYPTLIPFGEINVLEKKKPALKVA